MDLAVKWRLFLARQSGGDVQDATRVYLWHLSERRKRTYDGNKGGPYDPQWQTRFLSEAFDLHYDMLVNGFDARYPVPLDEDGELMGGAHRVACALAVGCEVVVQTFQTKAWAPPWDRSWFVEHDMNEADMKRLDEDWAWLST